MATAVQFAGCASVDPTQPMPVALRLSAAERQWKTAGLAHYRFKRTLSCGECPPGAAGSVTVVVANGAIVAVTGASGVSDRNLENYQSIETLFASLRHAAQRGLRNAITFDAQLGYPRRVLFGVGMQDGAALLIEDVSEILSSR